MNQQSRKDYLQRLIDEFFSKLHQLKDSESVADPTEKKRILKECFDFFSDNFKTKQSDDAETLIQKIGNIELLEQYSKLLLTRHEIVDIKDIVQLHSALDIVKYLEVADISYSWDRNILKEDLLRLLDTQNN